MRSHSGLQLIFLALLSFVLAACGGSGGGDSDAPSTFSVSGTATGLSGSVTLQNNGAETLTLSDNSGFTIANSVSDGTAYNVVLLNQPDGQTCSVSNGEGLVTGADVNDILVSCTDNPVSTHSIGGTVSGLSGTLVLQNNGGDDLPVSSNGSFTFVSEIDDTATYRVSVLNQPAGQTCSLSKNEGTVTSADITDIVVSCNTAPASTFNVGGTVTGLSGTLVLRNNDGDELTLTSNGNFSFAVELSEGSLYAVSILNQPRQQNCSLGNENGVISGQDVSDIAVSCSDTNTEMEFGSFTINDGSGPKKIEFNWTRPTGTLPSGQVLDHYHILENPDGISGFTPLDGAEAIANTETTHEHTIAVHLTDWINAIYIIEARAADGTVLASAQVGLVTELNSVVPIGYFKASNTGDQDHFGWSLALSSDGNTLAVGAPQERSNAIGINGNETNNDARRAGAVYVFSRNGGPWIQEAYIKASNTDEDDQFGHSVALSADGNTLAVGAIAEDSDATGINGDQANFDPLDISTTGPNSGAVYVFRRNDDTWTQEAYVKASNPGIADTFGWSLALSSDGNTLAVGAYLEGSSATGINGEQNDDALFSGAVYVFARANDNWEQQAYVKASNTGFGDGFGISVALSGDGNTLAVGAYLEDSAATGINGEQTDNLGLAGDSGAVYLYNRNNSVWTQQAYIKASNTGLQDRFGSTVALSGDGDTLAVGAHFEDSAATGINGQQTDDPLTENSGAVYVYSRSNGVWTQQAYVKASNTDRFDQFGGGSPHRTLSKLATNLSLSTDGNTLAVGAFTESSDATGINGNEASNLLNASGAVYVFSRSGGAWKQAAYVKASNTDRSDQFGKSAALSGDGNTLAIGAFVENSDALGIDGDQADRDSGGLGFGAVYLY